MQLSRLLLGALLLASCNSILGNTDHHLVDDAGGAGSGPAPTEGGAGAGTAGTAGTAEGGAGGDGGGPAAGAGGAQSPESCDGVVCKAPPPDTCKNVTTKTSHAATGTCKTGTCSYKATDTLCEDNERCDGEGVCSVCKLDTSCEASCGACRGATPKCKDLGATSKCVACVSDDDCKGATPFCDATLNICGAQRSCTGLAKTCGPAGTTDCCASSVVAGATFNRSNDGKYPATVSSFRLDNYEITVGRFRKFVAAYSQAMTPAGAGKNPNNGNDNGWDTAWNTSLAASLAALKTAVKCDASVQTWKDTEGNAAAESLPINCLSWFEAQAFCIWDNGRLPTEAEWNYAAAGGDMKRAYPWGAPAPNCTYANYFGGLAGTDYCTAPGIGATNRVGSESTMGDGRYGQSDLAGNVWEWTQDWYATPYAVPCNNCSNFTDSGLRVVRGGSFEDPTSFLATAYRSSITPSHHNHNNGARCARAP